MSEPKKKQLKPCPFCGNDKQSISSHKELSVEEIANILRQPFGYTGNSNFQELAMLQAQAIFDKQRGK